MYDQHEGLKDRLTSVIDHLLTTTEFEKAWGDMVEEFELHNRITMQKLYDERRMWIESYFKEILCGTIQSTQRSESMNSVVKGG